MSNDSSRSSGGFRSRCFLYSLYFAEYLNLKESLKYLMAAFRVPVLRASYLNFSNFKFKPILAIVFPRILLKTSARLKAARSLLALWHPFLKMVLRQIPRLSDATPLRFFS